MESEEWRMKVEKKDFLEKKYLENSQDPGCHLKSLAIEYMLKYTKGGQSETSVVAAWLALYYYYDSFNAPQQMCI